MTSIALAALKKSIAHWRRLLSGKTRPHEIIGPFDCALCEKFATVELHCVGCPVHHKTQRTGCEDTPY